MFELAGKHIFANTSFTKTCFKNWFFFFLIFRQRKPQNSETSDEKFLCVSSGLFVCLFLIFPTTSLSLLHLNELKKPKSEETGCGRKQSQGQVSRGWVRKKPTASNQNQNPASSCYHQVILSKLCIVYFLKSMTKIHWDHCSLSRLWRNAQLMLYASFLIHSQKDLLVCFHSFLTHEKEVSLMGFAIHFSFVREHFLHPNHRLIVSQHRKICTDVAEI